VKAVGFCQALGATVLLAVGLSTGCSSTDPVEQKYLDAMHNPCQHPEVFDHPTTYCRFDWEGSGSAQVSEGRKVCAIEKDHPDAIYDAPFNYLHSRHPDYSRIQINTQLIAAEKTLCRG
jgi:hypothetical protein